MWKPREEGTCLLHLISVSKQPCYWKAQKSTTEPWGMTMGWGGLGKRWSEMFPFPSPWESIQGVQKLRSILGLLISFTSLVVEMLSFSHQYIAEEFFIFLNSSAGYRCNQSWHFVTISKVTNCWNKTWLSMLCINTEKSQKIPI